MLPYSKILLALFAWLLLAPACLAGESIDNGIYLIEKRSNKNVKAKSGTQIVLKNNPKFLQSEAGTTFFILKKKPFVPLVLDREADKGIDDKGRPKLLLSLEPEQVKPLEKLTGENIGKDIAIVLDDRVVSAHQIKQKIKNGQFQITRCHDNGCATLYIELKKRKEL